MSFFDGHRGRVNDILCLVLSGRSKTQMILEPASNALSVKSALVAPVSGKVSVGVGLMECQQSGRGIDYCDALLHSQAHQVVIVRRQAYDHVGDLVPWEVVERDEEVILRVCAEQLASLSGRLRHVVG